MNREKQIAQATAELRAILAAKEVTIETRRLSARVVYECVRPAKHPQFILDPPPEYSELLAEFCDWEGELHARSEEAAWAAAFSHPA
jgi:hypothetical protein